MNLFEITKELEEVLNNIEIDEDGCVVNDDKLEAVEEEFKDKVEGCACYFMNLEAEIKALKDKEDNFKERRTAKEKKLEWLKSYIGTSLLAVGMEKFETANCKLSFRKSTSVNVYNEEELPEEYLKVETSVKPDKNMIKDAIKKGAVIPGASLEDKQSLQIK